MGSWLDTKKKLFQEKFESFAEEKRNENDSKEKLSVYPKFILGQEDRGTESNPKSYELRLLPDNNGDFYKKIYYHMFQLQDGSWKFICCPKTHGHNHYCPWCSLSNKLYSTKISADEKNAEALKRKEKFVTNVFVVDDPRDAQKEDQTKKYAGTIRLYEFPGAIEKMLRYELTDSKNGIGFEAYDPSNGRNFILRVGATKPNKGKTWPDYKTSKFAARASSLGTDDEIQAIMEKTIDLNEYINSMTLSNDDHIQILKDELFIEYPGLKEELSRFMGISFDSQEVQKTSPAINKMDEMPVPDEPKKEVQHSTNTVDPDTEALLKELEIM